ncbi:uncharacterized protein LOC113070334 [Carassius auratus]|uniref:Uncharacterized protein LOC113070334 n=1 Tax=Carassius auratus TaxID=7957 RepID=A0A6P6MRR7_CARAU|nr:uncharacterized protein LOC113070334 [Carassius auratus]
MLGDMAGPVTVGFWRTPPLDRVPWLAHFICLLTSLYLVLKKEDPSPLSSWLMRRSRCEGNLRQPFPGRTLPLERRVFNYRLSRARLVVENAFVILTSQWTMYRRLIEVHPEIVEKCVKVTCVLHNLMRCSEGREAPAVRGTGQVGEEPLPGLGWVAAKLLLQRGSPGQGCTVSGLSVCSTPAGSVPGCQVHHNNTHLIILDPDSLTFPNGRYSTSVYKVKC